MGYKTELLNKLFEDWKAARPVYKGFKRDGIVDEDLYDKVPRLLFICKEPNDPSLTEDDYRDWWNKHLRYTFSRRIGEWAFGIMNGFPLPNTFADLESHLALRSIAFLNVKKTGGSSRVHHSSILDVIKKDLIFIKQQIDIIDPSIIICSLGVSNNTRALFPEFEGRWIETGYNVLYVEDGGKIFVDFYHPSVPAPGEMSYVLLEKVFNVIRSGKGALALKNILGY